MEDRRRLTRINLGIEAEIVDENQFYRAEVLDISLKGILLKCPLFKGTIGQSYLIQISLSTEIIMAFNSLLVHQENRNFGFKFISESLDSLTHLQSLLEFNSEDPDIIQQELFFLRE